MLQKKDLKLLYELDSNYRKSYTEIGKKVRMSEQLISYKVKSLVKEGIIQGYFPLIDYSRFGLLSFVVFFKVKYRSEQNFQKLITFLCAYETIILVIECDGKYDLMVMFLARNPSHFNKKLKQLVSINGELRDWTILTTVVEHYYLRDYLVDKEGQGDTIIGGDRDEIKIDQLNKDILSLLTQGRKKVIELALELKTTPKTIMARLKWLEQQNILRGYRLLLNAKAMKISANLILLKYKNITQEQEDHLRQFCKYNPLVIEFAKTFGEWDAVLSTETRDRAEFRKLFLQLREKFDDIIADTDTFRVFAVHKKQCLPEEILV